MSGDRDDDFAGAMKGVRPLEDREKRLPRPAPAARVPSGSAPAPRFLIERQGADVFARREDVSRRTLADLRAGRTPVGCEIDLHGLAARRAQRELLSSLDQAWRDGSRCVLVIHGAGHHSEGGPVLKSALPGWLTEGPLAGAILAFATAPRNLGGAGASLVLLRRAR